MNSGLLGPNGRAVETYRKEKAPKTGPAYGVWSGERSNFISQIGTDLPILQFDLSQLTLEDYRVMRTHHQINASLTVLTFMLHQIDWWIECEDPKIQEFIDENMRNVWTRLIRGMSQAFWSGYSGMILEWDNDVANRKLVLSKVKDLYPEEAEVHWKEIKGSRPATDNNALGAVQIKNKVYDGIKQHGVNGYIEPEYTMWYPLLMENGDMYGRKILKAAFAPWYFSVIMHLYSNRYFERFGEPVPVGRADFSADVQNGDGENVSGRDAIIQVLTDFRSRGVVALPSDRDENGEYEFDLDYVESQMRGADFDRYISMLDEEISLALFTPILMFRTGDVGSHNLGVQHTQTWLWMLNALAGDMKEYIDRYIINRLHRYNYPKNAPRAQWKYRLQGHQNQDTMRSVITELLRDGAVGVDLSELSRAIGLTVEEELALREKAVEGEGGDDPESGEKDKNPTRDGPRGVDEPRNTAREIEARIAGQVDKAWREERFGTDFKPTLGYRRKFEAALRSEGASDERAGQLADQFYTRVESWVGDAKALGTDGFQGPKEFMAMFTRLVDSELTALTDG